MILLHQIGERINPNFNTLEEILACNEPLSFDGVYLSVYENYELLKGKDITFFYSGKYLGGDNSFDTHTGQPLSKFCTLNQIHEMAIYLDAKIGFHGYAHIRCVGLNEEQLYMELTRRACLARGSLQFAWPYGDYDTNAIQMAEKMGYTEAWSAMQGDDNNPFAKKRKLLNWG